jgi:hypothetical protein
VKVAFDEHVPTTIAKVFIALTKEKVIQRTCKGLIVEKAEDYAPKTTDADYVRKSDVPWVDRFAKAGGRAIISGDTKMRRRPHERLALYDHNLVVIFFENQWCGLTFFRKSSLLLHWWEAITTKLQTAEPGTFWAVPSQWPPKGGELKNVSLGLAQLLKDSPVRVTKTKRARKAQPRQKRDESGQHAFIDLWERRNASDKGWSKTD